MTEITKIVINRCYGGFGVSEEGMRRYAEIKGWRYEERVSQWYSNPEKFYVTPIIITDTGEELVQYDLGEDRTDPALVQVVEELGNNANGECAKLYIEELPKGTLYRIEEYDGMEHIETAHEVEWKVA